MSSTDKTEEKLLSSMRRTKAAAADKSAKPQSQPAPATRDKPTTQRAQRKTAAASKTKPASSSSVGQGDPYQSGRRIWPD